VFSLHVSFRFVSFRLDSHRLMLIILRVYVSLRVESIRFVLSRRILIPEEHSQELLVWKLGVPRFDVAINLLDFARGGE
jgi:hypothetical protein